MRILLTGGGTGGHIVPHATVIDNLKRETFLYLGSNSGLEEKFCVEHGIAFRGVSTGKIRRYFSPLNFLDIFKIPVGILQSLWHIYRFKPDVIFSKGGYVAVPVVIAGGILKKKIIAHESDFTPGLATKISAYFATTICVPHIKTKEKFSKKMWKKIVVTGNPVRAEIIKGSKKDALKFLNLKALQKPVLLVMGGSTGAQKLNELVWKKLPEILRKFTVVHITGDGKGSALGKKHKNYFEFEYLGSALKDIYAITSVVVCRSGAGSVSEINALGIPAVYIPLGGDASRGDQWDNAKHMSETPCIVLDEKNINGKQLIAAVDKLSAVGRMRSESPNDISKSANMIVELIMKKEENPKLKFIDDIGFFVLALLLFLLPLHAFGSVFLNYGLGLAEIFKTPAVISMWKEFLMVILAIFLFSKFLKNKKMPNLDIVDKLILAYIGFGIAHAFIIGIPMSQFIWGARYDYSFFLIFLAVKHFGFSDAQIKSLFKITILGGVLSLIIGYLIHFILGPENLTALGFRNDWSTWYPGQSLAFCQRVENQELCRMSGTFAGPNQLGAYLVLLLPLIYMLRKKLHLVNAFILSVLTIAALYFTYSRGAYIGALTATVVLAVYHFKPLKYSKYLIFGILALVISGAIAFTMFTVPDALVRPESTGEHFTAWKTGIDEMVRRPLGLGLGSAGPASYRTDSPIIPESWYLQVGVELGFIGLALFLAVVVFLAKNLSSKNPYLLASFLGVLSISLFLHTLEDSAVSITLFALAGLSLSSTDRH